MKNTKTKKKGFTLIELMVVVAIMGLLAALAVISLNNARARARDARRISDIKQVQTALELYYLDNQEYPDTPTDGDFDGDLEGLCISDNGTKGIDTSCSGDVYMRVTPSNPQPRGDGDCGNTPYKYTAVTEDNSNTSYYITYCLGSETGDVPAGTQTATPAGLDD